MWPCVAGRVCGNRFLQRLMSPSPESQVMFASAFSCIGDFFRLFDIHTFYAMATIYTPGAHALTPAALTSCAHVWSLVIGWILFEHMSGAHNRSS